MEFQTKKKFGQNFLTDKNLLSAIVCDAEISCDDVVLEIGPGMGALTEELSKKAKRVVCFEIDKELKPYLEEKGLKNVEFHFQDVMDKSLEEIEGVLSEKYKLVANLPYYITSPILFKFLGSKNLQSITVMVQKEVAERIIAKEGSKDYGVLSVSIACFGTAKITRFVSREMFNPKPNVDSAVVRIDIRKKEGVLDFENFFNFVKSIFSMRRKTLLNNLTHAYSLRKDKLDQVYTEEELKKRAEAFSVDEIVGLYKKLLTLK